jgi:hypothetical protein
MTKVYCEMCGQELTSPRSKRLGIGQRCKWKRDGRPTRKRTKTLGTGPPIDDVPYEITGDGRNTIQLRLDARW